MRAKRLADEAEDALIEKMSRFAISGTTGLFAVITLLIHGLMIAVPFLILAVFIYTWRH